MPFVMPVDSLEHLLSRRALFLAFVRRRVPDAAAAEDILQSCYVRALEHRDEFDSGESAVAWFYRLLRNAVIDNYRRAQSQSKALTAWGREMEGAAQPSPEMQRDVCACLSSVVDDLKPEYADAIRQVDLNEQKVQDFAEQRNLTASNAGVRVHRARAALRKQLLRTCGSCAEHGCLDCVCRKAHPGAAGCS
ncbi:sigma-70 family RNA polymerase sigma factor [Terriglobus aquaticus]|uniref:Sigma-70 family RNA polymerase sigma factor n=1 Tax=Terriglobus aquaticus TaxID=940139 RepID=A0ABW9KGD4_9BACT|nr:sigma-70 family RNA polymerase sigma factor [Terriglobus aquaticus]